MKHCDSKVRVFPIDFANKIPAIRRQKMIVVPKNVGRSIQGPEIILRFELGSECGLLMP